MSTSPIRTLLIEDSAFMRIIITDMLRAEKDIELVGVAKNGKDGVDKTLELRPDVVITDMVMPLYDGLYAVKNIMNKKPTPIILISSLERNDTLVFDALEAGAVDFIDKPKGNSAIGGGQGYHLPDLIRAVSKSRGTLPKPLVERPNLNNHVFTDNLNYRLIAIGASTGGPGAIEVILKKMPANLAIPVVIAQHMPEGFLESFAKRLDALSPLKVKLAYKGETPEAGTIYLAPGMANTQLVRNPLNGQITFEYVYREYKEFNNPSIDCLFESVAQVYGNKALAVVLTGMGKDGTVGLQAIKNKGGFTIGQDEKSSVVYGMPKSAYESGAISRQVSLNDIPGFIISCL
ncbi:chemotaxis-specific protein-glutamate methyltransferase CheB [Cytophagales bacterium LB-30]|uniref:Protein-glutamate methylesterase/protein-glutamine glutaminase n=1 Tax=Shiella aurantiaca TaxID=3058365 RepID=A0ABT8F624_9BACT|nr:chemotaxis-specific protein-glutamate methyltransferase CheB [Shiella aurantiaca]MDN4165912.1 chemotaxis-specific protein-glutamate methyltransferase CheB [Shiella aurantiaca]